MYKDKQSAATKRKISGLKSLSLKDKDNTDEGNSGNSKCTDENIKKKMKKWKKSCGVKNYQWKKATKQKSYLQQPTKPLPFKSNFKSI